MKSCPSRSYQTFLTTVSAVNAASNGPNQRSTNLDKTQVSQIQVAAGVNSGLIGGDIVYDSVLRKKAACVSRQHSTQVSLCGRDHQRVNSFGPD